MNTNNKQPQEIMQELIKNYMAFKEGNVDTYEIKQQILTAI